MTGIALIASEVPLSLTDAPAWAARRHERAGRVEFQFHWWQSPALLPVRWEGVLRLLPWGDRRRGTPLPRGGWIEEERVPGLTDPEEAVIPASLGHHRGTWFLIHEGVRGVVIRDGAGKPVVYMLMRPATNYYRNMTEQSPLMPALVGQVI